MQDTSRQSDRHSPRKIRHEVRVRTLEVLATERLSPSMVRLVLGGPEMEGFTTAAFDDHVKIFIPDPGEPLPRLPSVGPNGIFMPDGIARPIARDYTVRRYDAQAGRLEIDFVVHEQGAASDWADTVKPGDSAWIAGPRGSFLIPQAFDWYLLIGDETALPAIARRIEELPDTTRAIAVIETAGAEHDLACTPSAGTTLLWAHRDGAPAGSDEALLGVMDGLTFPDGSFHAWIGCESQVAKTLRAWLIEHRNADPKRIRASGYWRRGEAGYHDHA